jgi:hypothetical protein
MKAIRMSCLCAALALLAVLAGTPARAADEEVPSFKKRGDNEKTFVTKVGTAIVKAAHPTAKTIEVDKDKKYEITEPKKGRKELRIRMTYQGAVSKLVKKTPYVADIVVLVDSTDKEKWEVLNIKYKDDNKVPHSEKKVQALISRFNK